MVGPIHNPLREVLLDSRQGVGAHSGRMGTPQENADAVVERHRLSRYLTLPEGFSWASLRLTPVAYGHRQGQFDLEWVACFCYDEDWFVWWSVGRELPSTDREFAKAALDIQGELDRQAPQIKEADAAWRAGSEARPPTEEAVA